jgi:hypothetical protein
VYVLHIPLNSYLARFHRVDSARCPACPEQEETVEHFLLKCPGCAHERWVLESKLKGDLTLTTILSGEKAIILLANYIEATHRFAHKVSNNS